MRALFFAYPLSKDYPRRRADYTFKSLFFVCDSTIPLMRLIFSLSFLLHFTVFFTAFPQAGQDTTFLASAVKKTIAAYQNGIGAQARLYNGSKYAEPEHTFEQHPYFLSIDWLPGDIVYDGESFENVSLMLDLNSGQLITEHYSNGQSLQLVQEKVHSFRIAGHLFENIENDSVGNSLPGSGYYEILYGGKTSVAVKRQKLLHEEIENASIEITFEEKNRYYIFKDSVFNQIKSKASLIKLLGDKKQQIKKLLRQKKLRMRDNREVIYKSVAEYYDGLTP
jgi:hypothetical protein